MKKRNIALAGVGAVGAAVALKLLTRAKTVDFERVFDQVPHSERSQSVAVDGARIHYQEFGDSKGPVMLLIHGYTASVYAWRSAAPLLAAHGFRVIAVDLIGFGFSAKPAAFQYTIQSQAHMISRFMDRLGIGRAIIVGSSYGGAVAATIALDYAERVEKLVLVDAVINDEAKNHPLLQLVRFRGLGEALTPFLADSRRLLKHRMHRTLAPSRHHLITQDRIDSILRPLKAADGHRSLLATSRAWDANRIEQDASLIDQETLIVWGEEDSVIPIKNGYMLHDEILHSKFVVLKECGHVPQEEDPELFTELVTAFAMPRPVATA